MLSLEGYGLLPISEIERRHLDGFTCGIDSLDTCQLSLGGPSDCGGCSEYSQSPSILREQRLCFVSMGRGSGSASGAVGAWKKQLGGRDRQNDCGHHEAMILRGLRRNAA